MLILSLKIDKQSFLSFWTDGSVMGWASTVHSGTTLYTVNSTQYTLHITLHSTPLWVGLSLQTALQTAHWTLESGRYSVMGSASQYPRAEPICAHCTVPVCTHLCTDEHCAQCSPVHSAHMCTLSISAQCLSVHSTDLCTV